MYIYGLIEVELGDICLQRIDVLFCGCAWRSCWSPSGVELWARCCSAAASPCLRRRWRRSARSPRPMRMAPSPSGRRKPSRRSQGCTA